MGTLHSANHEWIELYNGSDSSVDLSGWTLWAEDGIPKISLSGSIPGQGYFLLERSSDSTVNFDPPVLSDLIYTGALVDAGEILVLRDASGTEIDRVDSWYFGAVAGRISMERISFLEPGTEEVNWADNNGLITTGNDAAGNPIRGTPKYQNSVAQ